MKHLSNTSWSHTRPRMDTCNAEVTRPFPHLRILPPYLPHRILITSSHLHPNNTHLSLYSSNRYFTAIYTPTINTKLSSHLSLYSSVRYIHPTKTHLSLYSSNRYFTAIYTLTTPNWAYTLACTTLLSAAAQLYTPHQNAPELVLF
jgi:hypothetical protein